MHFILSLLMALGILTHRIHVWYIYIWYIYLHFQYFTIENDQM